MGIKQNFEKGFTLVEVMIAVFVFAIGMLGIAGLQLKAYQSGHMAYARTIATMQANSLAERMRANPTGVTAGNYALASTSTPPGFEGTCKAGGCAPNLMASNDLSEWVAEVQTALPNAVVQVCLDSTPELTPTGGAGSGIVCDGLTNEWVIYIDWLDQKRLDDPDQTSTKRFTLSFVP